MHIPDNRSKGNNPDLVSGIGVFLGCGWMLLRQLSLIGALLLHLFTVLSVWNLKGALGGLASLFLPVFAEIYLLFEAARVNPNGWANNFTIYFSIVALGMLATNGLHFVTSLLLRNREQSLTSKQEGLALPDYKGARVEADFFPGMADEPGEIVLTLSKESQTEHFVCDFPQAMGYLAGAVQRGAELHEIRGNAKMDELCLRTLRACGSEQPDEAELSPTQKAVRYELLCLEILSLGGGRTDTTTDTNLGGR